MDKESAAVVCNSWLMLSGTHSLLGPIEQDRRRLLEQMIRATPETSRCLLVFFFLTPNKGVSPTLRSLGIDERGPEMLEDVEGFVVEYEVLRSKVRIWTLGYEQ